MLAMMVADCHVPFMRQTKRSYNACHAVCHRLGLEVVSHFVEARAALAQSGPSAAA